jgi:hypothetical protein
VPYKIQVDPTLVAWTYNPLGGGHGIVSTLTNILPYTIIKDADHIRVFTTTYTSSGNYSSSYIK